MIHSPIVWASGAIILFGSYFAAASEQEILIRAEVQKNLIKNGNFALLDSASQPTGWSIQEFRGHPKPTLSVEKEAKIDGNAVTLQFDSAAEFNQALSFYYRLPELDTTRRAKFSFKYKCQGLSGSGKFSYSISAGPGNRDPSGRTWCLPQADGQWHAVSVEVPLRGMKPVGSVAEFGFNSLADSKPTISFAEVDLAYQADAQPIAIHFTQPISGVLFNDDPNSKISGSINIWEEYVKHKVRLRLVKDEAGKGELKSKEIVCKNSKQPWDFDCSDLPVGQYHLIAELLAADGSAKAVAREQLSKLEPSQEIPRIIGGTLHYQGKPFLPIGLMHVTDWVLDIFNSDGQGIGAPPVTRDEMLSSIKSRGFNTVTLHKGDSPEFIQAVLRHHLLALPSASPGHGSSAELSERVLRHAKVPHLLGWYGVDEPTLGPLMDRALGTYRTLKQLDPYRTVWACAYMPSPLVSLNYEGTFADAILVDRYEVRSPTSDLSTLGHYVHQVAEYTERNPGLLVGVTPQVFIYLGSEPSVEQLRAQTYLGVVNGAKAFMFYSYSENFGTRFTDDKVAYPLTPSGMSKNPKRTKWWLPESVLWDAFPQLNQELQTLEDFILRGEVIPVRSHASKIQFLAKNLGTQRYFVAVNPTAETQQTSYNFLDPVRLQPCFKTLPAPTTAQEIELSFQPYEVKVFEILPPE